MFRHLTILVLSVCIGMPMCWCCMDAGTKELPVCCAKAATSQHDQTPERHNCPCAKHEAAREVAGTTAQVPAPVLKFVFEPAWQSSSANVFLLPRFEQDVTARHDHGPPWSTVPVYTRHCALLL
ncbi:MAG: hypothetical protein R3F13_14885 [Prosthecobacter sp.]